MQNSNLGFLWRVHFMLHVSVSAHFLFGMGWNYRFEAWFGFNIEQITRVVHKNFVQVSKMNDEVQQQQFLCF